MDFPFSTFAPGLMFNSDKVNDSWKERAKNKKEKEMTMSGGFLIMHRVKSEMSQGEIRASYKRCGNTSQLIVNLTVSP